MFTRFKNEGTEGLLKSVLDTTFNGIMTFQSIRNESGAIVDFEWIFVNDVAEEIVSMKAEELLGQHLLAVMPGNKDAGLFDRYVKTVETGNPEVFEQFYPGEEMNKWFRISAIKLNDGFTVTFQDVTDLKEALIDAQNKERKYLQLFEESIDAIFITNSKLNVLEVNPAMEKIAGRKAEALLLKPAQDFFAKKEMYELFTQQLTSLRQVVEFEADLQCSKGENRPCLINGIALTRNENEERTFLVVAKDITKRKQADKDLLMAEKLSMTGKIARTIAHEVRNPITNLTLAIDQLKEEIPQNVEDADLYFTIIKRNTKRISKLITDLLNSSKPKELELKKADLNEKIREAVRLVEDRIKLKQMRLELQLNENLPAVFIDAEQLNMAILNLLLNAIEAMQPEKGCLQVATNMDSDWIKIEVKDNGKGMSQQQMTKLFEPFFTAKKEGTGLGMITVQNIVNSHSGRIDVQSTLGLGTTFTIYLPIVQTPN